MIYTREIYSQVDHYTPASQVPTLIKTILKEAEPQRDWSKYSFGGRKVHNNWRMNVVPWICRIHAAWVLTASYWRCHAERKLSQTIMGDGTETHKTHIEAAVICTDRGQQIAI